MLISLGQFTTLKRVRYKLNHSFPIMMMDQFIQSKQVFFSNDTNLKEKIIPAKVWFGIY